MNPIERIKKSEMKCLKLIYEYTGYTESLEQEIDNLASFILFEEVRNDHEILKVFSP